MNLPSLAALLAKAPVNWGRWGPDDEIGCLNYLDAAQVLRGVAAVRSGSVFALQTPIDGTAQSTTHVDGLGHAWYGGQLWNGHPAESASDGTRYAGTLPIAERGIVGRGVLLDIARHRQVDALGPGDTFGQEDLLACAEIQHSPVEACDILLIRTGWPRYYCRARQAGHDVLARLDEPGLRYSEAAVTWFRDTPIPVLVTDTISSEAAHDPGGDEFPLHAALMRNLGVVFTELADLDDLAADCARDRQYTFLYVCAPLKVADSIDGPVNPVAIK